MVCGDPEHNPGTLGLDFVGDDDGGVAARFRPTARHQGYAGLLHGGMICTLLDAAMTNCLFVRGIAALTAEMTVRFVAPVALGQEVEVAAHLVERRRNLCGLEASMTANGRLLARAVAKFMVVDASLEPEPAGGRA